MKRYQLRQLYTFTEFNNLGKQIAQDYNAVAMNPTSGQYDETINFVMSAIYGYFYADLVAYFGETKAGVRSKLRHRLGLDISIKLPYWYKKYKNIKKLLTTEDLSLLQTSKMTSSSSDNTDSASGTLQKTATTPTGVSTGSATDGFNIFINSGNDTINTTGFADKYTNAQQKFANASKVKGTRSGEVLREGSIDDLLNVLEKLPSSFADEVLKDMQKHFIYDYDGELLGQYDFTEGDFGMGIIIGKTRTNQPVEEVEGFEDAVNEVLADVELGTKLYLHKIKFMVEGPTYDICLLSKENTPYNNITAIKNAINDKVAFVSGLWCYTQTGATQYAIRYLEVTSNSINVIQLTDSNFISDTVTEL